MKTATALKARLTPLTPLAILFTLVSLSWTGWSITDLVHSGAWGLLAAVSVDGLWGTVQYLSYKGIGGRFVETIEWITLAVACALLGWHGWTITPAAAFAGALPPIVAKIAWTGDIRLRRDPTALTADQEAEINAVIRDSEYISRRRAAEIEREAAEEVALIRAQGKVTLERDDVTFQVELERIRKREEIQRRTPLALTANTQPAANTTPANIPAAPEHEHPASSPNPIANTIASPPNSIREHVANKATTSPNADREQLQPNTNPPGPNTEQPSIADLVREQIASTTDNATAVRAVLAVRPDANRESVAAAVRRARRKEMEGGYG